MSTYDDSSLFLYPSGYKASVLFAQKPMDANGQLAFTRSNDTATRVDENGLIEKVRTNVALQSQTFDNASWTKDASSITANTIAAPDGTLTAETLTADGTSAPHGIRQTGTATLTNGIVYSTSIYAKKGTNDFIQIVGSTAPYVTFNVFANFDLNNGVVGTVGSSVTATIQDAGNGWYRCTMIASAAATSSTNSFIVQIVSSASAARGESNSLATSVFLWGAQLETSDFGPTPYIPTVAAAVSVGPLANIPRIDYLGGGCGKLLLEPQRSNLLTFSEQFDNAGWTKTFSSITANIAVSPDGYTNADKLIPNTTLDVHQASQVITLADNTSYALSCFAKADGYNFLRLAPTTKAGVTNSTFFNLSNGTIGTVGVGHTASIASYGNGWYRCTIVYNSATGASSTNHRVAVCESDNQISFAGNGTSGIFIYGAQLEAGSYASSYVPTLAASVTRGADSCSKTGISSLIGQTEGTLFVEATLNRTGVSQNIELGDGTANNRIDLRLNSNNNYQLVIVQGGVVVFNQISGATFAQGETVKIAAAYKSGDSTVVYVNGVAVAGGTAGTITGSLSAIFNGSTGGTLDPMNSPIKQLLLFKTRLPNSELAALTA